MAIVKNRIKISGTDKFVLRFYFIFIVLLRMIAIFLQQYSFLFRLNKSSMFNTKEVDVVMDYIKKLLTPGTMSQMPIAQCDIGVVTPYKLQCKIIARACRKSGLKNITVGTAEVFQGQERPVMIVSTVRSDGQLGFVKNPRVRQFFRIPFHAT